MYDINITMVRLKPRSHFALMCDMSPWDLLLSLPRLLSRVTLRAMVPRLSLRLVAGASPSSGATATLLLTSSLMTMAGGGAGAGTGGTGALAPPRGSLLLLASQVLLVRAGAGRAEVRAM